MTEWPLASDDATRLIRCPYFANVNGGRCVGQVCGMWKSVERTHHYDVGYEVTRMEDVGYRVFNKGLGVCSLYTGPVMEKTDVFVSTYEKEEENEMG